jgi:hypothetical protein
MWSAEIHSQLVSLHQLTPSPFEWTESMCHRSHDAATDTACSPEAFLALLLSISCPIMGGMSVTQWLTQSPYLEYTSQFNYSRTQFAGS